MRLNALLLLLGALLLSPWVKANGSIRYAPNPRFAPVDYITGEKEHKGIMAGYMELIQSNADTQFTYIYLPFWEQIIHGLQHNSVDIVAGIHYNESRTEFAYFTESLLKLPLFLVTQRTYRLPNEDLTGVKLAGVRGYASTDFIRAQFPKAKLLLFDSELEALMQTSSGQTDATVIDLAAATAFIETYGLSNLHHARELPFQWDIRIAVSKQQPEIFQLVQNALNKITASQRDSLYQAYIGLDLAKQQGFLEKYRAQYVWTLWIIGFLVAIIIVFYSLLQQQVRKKTEELQIQNERYHLATRAASDAIFEIYAETGQIHFEENFRQLFGYDLRDRHDSIEHWWNYVHAEDLFPLHSEIKKTLQSNKAFFTKQFRFLKANGQYAQVEVRCYLLRLPNNRVIRVVGALQDITKSQKQMFAISKQNEQLREIAWMQSHVIRAPLARLMGLVQLLQMEAYESDADRRALENLIAEASAKLDEVITEIVSKSAEVQGEIEEQA